MVLNYILVGCPSLLPKNLQSLNTRPALFKRWIVLSSGKITIHRISIRETSCAIQWTVIYPLALSIACSEGVFIGSANVFARESAMLKLPKRGLSPIFLWHKIKDGGYIVTMRTWWQAFAHPKYACTAGYVIYLLNNLGQASIIQKLDNAIHRINRYPANK